MTNKPLLILPKQLVPIPKGTPGGGGDKIQRPDFKRQEERLQPIFDNLLSAFVTNTPEGLQPEYVLVIDTIGRFETFKTIVEHIKGLEWLAEIDTDDIEPDDLFSDLKNPDKKLEGRLFLAASNIQAMQKLITLFNEWKGNKNNFKRGLATLHALFSQIKDIRFWNEEDRLRDRKIIENWNENLEYYKQENQNIKFEIQLWYKQNENKRREIFDTIKKLIETSGGSIGKECLINEINFWAIKAELPAAKIEQVINHEYTGIFKCNEVMLFRPIGQIVGISPSESFNEEFTEGEALNEPIAALLDGYPFANHKLLANRITILDPEEFAMDYTSADMKHGTSMASLITHCELDSNEQPLEYKLLIYPILKPYVNSINRIETIPENEFFEDLLVRAVRNIMQSIPSVKIINLSIGDSSQMFTRQMSSAAKVIDWLSYQFNILFCVSAGNMPQEIPFNKTMSEFESLSKDDKASETIRLLYQDRRNRRLLAPAESINAITVGALHSDDSKPLNIGYNVDLFDNTKISSPVSPFGFGFRKSIKPDILMPGGRQLYSYRNSNAHIFEGAIAPGQKVAISTSENNRESYTYTRGTSNATALTTRSAVKIYSVLHELKSLYGNNSIPDEYVTPIIKALLLHGAEWTKGKELIEQNLKTSANSRSFKRVITSFFGYGVPNINKVLECTAQRATAIGFGKLGNKKRHEFRFPLPVSLSGSSIARRLTITLAWISPINTSNRKYRTANLTFETSENKDFANDRQEADHNQVHKGTVQHEIFEGDTVKSFMNEDSIQIFVTCKEDASGLAEEVRYAIAVTLEVAENIDVPIYEEVRARIETRINI